MSLTWTVKSSSKFSSIWLDWRDLHRSAPRPSKNTNTFSKLLVSLIDGGWDALETSEKVELLVISVALIQSIASTVTIDLVTKEEKKKA